MFVSKEIDSLNEKPLISGEQNTENEMHSIKSSCEWSLMIPKTVFNHLIEKIAVNRFS